MTLPLVTSFVDLCDAVLSNDSLSANRMLQMIKKDMEKIADQFLGNMMHDASEFLLTFLNVLSSNLDQLASEETSVVNLVTTNFKYWLEESITCSSCGIFDSRVNSDVVFRVCIPHQELTTLQNLFIDSLDKEVRERRCDQCDGQHASVVSKLKTLPRALLIVIKRYSLCGEERNQRVIKNISAVDIPDTLYVDSITEKGASSPFHHSQGHNNASEQPSNKYILAGIVSHTGVDFNSGHYVADVKRIDKEGQWLKFSDSYVTPTDILSVR